MLVNGFFARPAISSSATDPTSDSRAIAVLHFATLGADESTKAFAAGLEGEIITRLTKQQVRAAAATEPPRDGEMLTGTVQRAGNRLRINVQLVDARSRVPRWAETYDREVTDVLALESEIAAMVAKAVAAKKI